VLTGLAGRSYAPARFRVFSDDGGQGGRSVHLFFSVGEPSGDQHAAHLIHELQQRQPDVRISGFGGPQMEQAGLQSLYRLTNLAVMGIFRVLPLLWRFYSLVKQARRFLAEQRPDAVVLVDFPGFNWWIARAAKAAGIPVFYYLPPQLWAWGPWRVEKVRRFVDHVLSGLPFEKQWYKERGIDVDYVGHPFFDEIADRPVDAQFVEQWTTGTAPTVAVLPGSRTQELARNWPVMVETLRRLHARHPGVRFLVACYRQSHRRHCLAHLLTHAPTLPVQLFVGKTPEIIEAADCALMVSGSVSLEMVARKTPAVVLYRISFLTQHLGRPLLQCPYISLPNLIAGREVMPEFISTGPPEGTIRGVVDVLDRWLRLPEERERAATAMLASMQGFGSTGATARTAELICERLSQSGQAAIRESSRAA